MSRDLSVAALAAVSAEVVPRTVAVEMRFASGTLRACGAPYDMVIGGNTFLGVGSLGGIGVTEESAELRAYGLTVQMSGIPGDMIATALAEAYQGRRATVWEVPLGADGVPVASPVVIFRGRMDTMTINDAGESSVVSVQLENRLADWDRARVRRYTDEDQQGDYPGDLGLQFVSATAEKEIIWPSRSFVPGGRGTGLNGTSL